MRYAICALSVGLFAIVAVPAGAAVLPGVPTDDSLLFSLNSRSGELVRDGKSKSRYELTLSGVGRDTTWFSDRPRRDAGHVSSKRLFKSWGRLGFRSSPPNSALVISDASRKSDTMALELKLRSYNPSKRRARFQARRLGSLGHGLDHLNKRLDRKAPVHFRSSSLFIDNTSSAVGCPIGQPQLLPRTGSEVRNMLPANGQMLQVPAHTALYSILGTRFGGDGIQGFALPNLSAPPGMQWYICTEGFYPSPGSLSAGCQLGEVDYWTLPYATNQTDPNWVPADGRTLLSAQYLAYVSTYGGGPVTFQTPVVPAPPGFVSLVCVGLDPPDVVSLSQADMYVGQPDLVYGDTGYWIPANGYLLSGSNYPALYQIIGDNFGGGGGPLGPFSLPKLPSPAAGISYYMAVRGYWPFGD